MIACRYGISLIVLHTRRDIPYLRVPMHHPLFISGYLKTIFSSVQFRFPLECEMLVWVLSGFLVWVLTCQQVQSTFNSGSD